MSQNMKQNPAAAIIQQLMNQNKDGPVGQQAIQMPELALRCAQFFHSLSQYCLYFYKNYNKEADIHKTKMIKKAQRSKNDKHESSKKARHQQRKARLQRGQAEPQLPKKPLTAYIIYFQDKKPSFAQKFPSLSLSQLTRLIAKDWKELNESQKKPYLDKAASDRKRYQSQMAQFKRKYHRVEGEEQPNQAIIGEDIKDFDQIMDIQAQNALIVAENQIKSHVEDDNSEVNDDQENEESSCSQDIQEEQPNEEAQNDAK